MKTYKLSSTSGRYIGLVANGFLILILVTVFVFSRSWPLLILIPVFGLIQFIFLKAATVIVHQGQLLVKRFGNQQISYPLALIADVSRIPNGMAIIKLKTGELITYIPNRFEVLEHFLDYGDHVMRKIEALDAEWQLISATSASL